MVWEGHTLSLAGCRCYINRVIASSLVHTMIVYMWSSLLLKRVESAIRNYLLTGNITKIGTNNINWARCYAPMDEGGFEVRSIHLANISFTCKLAWDIMKGDDSAILLHNWYFQENWVIRNFRKATFIWSGICGHAKRLYDGVRSTL